MCEAADARAARLRSELEAEHEAAAQRKASDEKELGEAKANISRLELEARARADLEHSLRHLVALLEQEASAANEEIARLRKLSPRRRGSGGNDALAAAAQSKRATEYEIPLRPAGTAAAERPRQSSVATLLPDGFDAEDLLRRV